MFKPGIYSVLYGNDNWFSKLTFFKHFEAKYPNALAQDVNELLYFHVFRALKRNSP